MKFGGGVRYKKLTISREFVTPPSAFTVRFRSNSGPQICAYCCFVNVGAGCALLFVGAQVEFRLHPGRETV